MIKETAMSKETLELHETEWVILKKVWELEPCAAPTVQEALAGEKGWAYTTVKTMMDRMVKKGLLKFERIRNLYLYRAAVTPAQAKKGEILRTLRRAFNDSLTPMMQFLLDNVEISDQEYAQRENLIKNRKKAQKNGTN